MGGKKSKIVTKEIVHTERSDKSAIATKKYIKADLSTTLIYKG
jgi:hypothetical protein